MHLRHILKTPPWSCAPLALTILRICFNKIRHSIFLLLLRKINWHFKWSTQLGAYSKILRWLSWTTYFGLFWFKVLKTAIYQSFLGLAYGTGNLTYNLKHLDTDFTYNFENLLNELWTNKCPFPAMTAHNGRYCTSIGHVSITLIIRPLSWNR